LLKSQVTKTLEPEPEQLLLSSKVAGPLSSSMMIDEIDNIVTCEVPTYRRADKNKEINDVIANWANNPNAYFQHFEGSTGGKSIIISNLQVASSNNAGQTSATGIK